MLRVASDMREDFQTSKILHQLCYSYRSTSLQTRRLVVTGHSLGGGVAALLAILLQHDFPDIQCFAFGTPGAVTDVRTAQETRGFITSIILGNDMVCRMSFRSICQLRDSVLDCICRAKKSKTAILRSAINNLQKEDLLYEPGEEPPSELKDVLLRFKVAIY
jgi:predicted lipase